MSYFDKMDLPVRRRLRATAAVALLMGAALGAANAQVPGNAYDYTRTIAFTWQANGALQTQTTEPTNAASCSVMTYGYDAYGNRSTTTVANCTGAAGRAKFPARSASATYDSVTVSIPVATSSVSVTVPAGVLRATSMNALQQQTIERYDPRFGVLMSSTDPNGTVQSSTIDDFGRVTAVVHSDNTRTLSMHCVIPGLGLDTTSNSSTANGDPMSCPPLPAGQAPSDAISFVQNELHNASGIKIGPFTRIFYDKLGRSLRVATEPFDGAGQPSALVSTLKVLDTSYSAYGQKVLETQSYFLSTQSSTTSGASDVGVKRTDYDDLGRTTAIYVADAKGQSGSQSYGAFGSRVSAGTFIAYTGLSSTFTNDLGQTRVEEHDANGGLARVTDANSAQLAFSRDAFGNSIGTRDALQNQIVTQFDVLGHKVQLNDPDKGVLVYCYDAIGQVKARQSSNMRGGDTPVACPNTDDVAVDVTGKTASAVATWTTMAYDVMGRVAQRIEPESTTTWSYDKYANGTSCGAGIGQLCEVVTSTGEDRAYLYDSAGRPTNQRTSFSGGPSFAQVLAYDATTQQVGTRTYPTGVQVGYNYTARGFLQNVVLRTSAQVNPLPNAQGQAATPVTLAANSVLWTAAVVNAWSGVEQESYGNGVAATTTYDAYTGRTTALSAGASGTVLSQSYVWDSLARVSSRADANGAGDGNAVSESFGYSDNVGRLTNYTVNAPPIPGLSRTVNLQYNALGMLLYKSDLGNYAYGAQNTPGVRPHALASVTGAGTTNYLYDKGGNLVSANGGKYQTLTYTSFDLPDSQSGASGPAGSPSYKWVYDESHARLKETHLDASGTRITWYLQPDNVGGLGFESESAPSGTISNRHYVAVAGRNIAVLVSTGALPTLAAGQMAPPALTCGTTCITLVKMEYWHVDWLGSLVSTTDHTGAVTQRYAYDPFGKRRYTNGNYDSAGNLVYDWSPTLNSGTARGFTGHEQLDDIGLVHMNGRIFDPTLGVFLQADPHITNPGNLQNFNRYGYCLNNPLSCTDPSGFDDNCPSPCAVTVTASQDGDGGDGGSFGSGGMNSSPQWTPGMFHAPVKGGFYGAVQIGGLWTLTSAAAVRGFVNWWKATKNYYQHQEAVKAAIIMLEGEGFRVIGTEEPAQTPGMVGYYRKYDIVAIDPTGNNVVGIEIKSTQAVTLQLDPKQVAFDVLAVADGAKIFRGDNAGVTVESVMYVGMTMGAQQDAKFQSTVLLGILNSANIPSRIVPYSSITQVVLPGK